MKSRLLLFVCLFAVYAANSQQLLLLDRFNGNRVVNDSTVTIFSSDVNLPELTQYFTMKNNTDKPLAVFLRKSVNFYADSTSDYYCFGIHCWPGNDSTDVADTIQPGAEDYTFATHVCHVRRFDKPPLQPGLSSVTYTVYDKTSFPEPVESTVTVIYHLSGLGVEDGHGGMVAGKRGLDLTVYPNPASGLMTLKTGELRQGTYSLLIFSSLGMQVESRSVSLQQEDLLFNVNNYLPGLYYGKLVPVHGSPVSFRFQVVN